ncbi:uncharacterized protein [Onthophagus taurus]|uniref:uncharacterized protein n=1 Tax=Onthophagus taurus TaxID=166361 RepID=UPI0039BE3CF3
MLCFKENALKLINESIHSGQVMDFGLFQITKDTDFNSQAEENIPGGSSRSLALSNAIYSKIEDFFKSRVIKFKLGETVEGRKKGGGGYGGGGYGGGGKNKGGGMLMMGGMAMMGMMTQLFMGKLAFLAGTALLLAKMALVLSSIAAFKKSSGDGGGKESTRIVYANTDSYGGGNHGYGWHRSLNPDEMQQLYQPPIYTTPNPIDTALQYSARRKKK